ncbi:MAG: hypothetical protein ACYDG2_04005 [Ruminiclostridium sp.]
MIREELKKIWRPGILAMLLLLGFVFNYMFMDFYIDHFPNGPYADGVFQTAKEWVREYGTSLKPEEEAEIVNVKLPELNAEADRYVTQNELCRQYGLTMYADFEAFYEENCLEVQGELTEEQQTLYGDAHIILNYLQGEDTNNIDGRLQATQSYTERYEQWQSEGADVLSWAHDQRETNSRRYTHAKAAFFGQDAGNAGAPMEFPAREKNFECAVCRCDAVGVPADDAQPSHLWRDVHREWDLGVCGLPDVLP